MSSPSLLAVFLLRTFVFPQLRRILPRAPQRSFLPSTTPRCCCRRVSHAVYSFHPLDFILHILSISSLLHYFFFNLKELELYYKGARILSPRRPFTLGSLSVTLTADGSRFGGELVRVRLRSPCRVSRAGRRHARPMLLGGRVDGCSVVGGYYFRIILLLLVVLVIHSFSSPPTSFLSIFLCVRYIF